jgi:hypothetical protein
MLTGWNSKTRAIRGPLLLLAATGVALIQPQAVRAQVSESNSSTVSSTATATSPEFVQFGGAIFGSVCTASSCTIFSSSAGIDSVDRLGVGEYTVNFKTGRFTKPPVCTAIGGGEPAAGIPVISAAPTTMGFTVSFPTSNGGAVDQFVSMICAGR